MNIVDDFGSSYPRGSSVNKSIRTTKSLRPSSQSHRGAGKDNDLLKTAIFDGMQ
jgi:hypothetical protein